MKILLAFTHMKVGGLSTYNYTIAKELINRNYLVHVWTNLGGDFESHMREICEVVSTPDDSYDVIILSNNDVVDYLNKHKIKGFRIYITHGIAYKNDIPSKGMADEYVGISPYIHKYIFNNTNVGYAHYIPPGIDCSNFYPKTNINKKLTNVLSLVKSNTANKIVKDSCLEFGINYTNWFQSDSTDFTFNINEYINEVDLVVGWGRTIIETMACGRVPVCYDINDSIILNGDNTLLNNIVNSNINIFGLITPNNISKLMESNFSIYSGFTPNFTVKSLVNQFSNYNPMLSNYYRIFAHNHFNVKTMVDKFFNLI